MLTYNLLTYGFFQHLYAADILVILKWNRKFILNLFTTVLSLCSWKKMYESEDVTYRRLFRCSFVDYLVLRKLFQFFRRFCRIVIRTFHDEQTNGNIYCA